MFTILVYEFLLLLCANVTVRTSLLSLNALQLGTSTLFVQKVVYFPCFDIMGQSLYSNLEMLSLLYNLALSDCHHRQLSKLSVLSLEMFFCLLRVDLSSCKH